MIPVSVYIFLFIQLVFISYFDIKYKKISNKWSLINIVFFIICLIAFPKVYPISLKILFIPFVIFIVSFALFTMKIMGAGDSKYLTVFYLMVPVVNQEESFWILTVVTIIVGVAIFLYNLIKNLGKIIEAFKQSDINGIKVVFGTRFSFAPIVLIAWVWFGWVNRLKIF